MAHTILISRTDSIGDVILTLPLCGRIKEKLENVKIVFLGREYTRPVIEQCIHVDYFLDWDTLRQATTHAAIDIIKSYDIDTAILVYNEKQVAQLLKSSNIPLRIGSSHRWYNWLYCNKRIHFTRKNSMLHESQLNFKLTETTLDVVAPDLKNMHLYYCWNRTIILPKIHEDLLSTNKKNIILHPKSKGSAREWDVLNWRGLIKELFDSNYKIFISGIAQDNEWVQNNLGDMNNMYINLCGLMDLRSYMAFVQKCDALVACSTGPLHIAAAWGVHAIGIYPPLRPLHPGRWAALGEKVSILVANNSCATCRKKKVCACINSISATQVMAELKKIN